mgnify:CR=1 FL=1
MSDQIETPVVEAAQSTVDKLSAKPAREFAMPTPGEYLAAMHRGGDTFAKVNAAFRDAARRDQSAIEAGSIR